MCHYFDTSSFSVHLFSHTTVQAVLHTAFLTISAARTHCNNNLSSYRLPYWGTCHLLLGVSVASPLSLRQKKAVTTFWRVVTAFLIVITTFREVVTTFFHLNFLRSTFTPFPQYVQGPFLFCATYLLVPRNLKEVAKRLVVLFYRLSPSGSK